jgi:hypothetical protein
MHYTYSEPFQKRIEKRLKKYKNQLKMDPMLLENHNQACLCCLIPFAQKENVLEGPEGINFFIKNEVKIAYPYAVCKHCLRLFSDGLNEGRSSRAYAMMEWMKKNTEKTLRYLLTGEKPEEFYFLMHYFYETINEEMKEKVFRSMKNSCKQYLKSKGWNIESRSEGIFLMEVYNFWVGELSKGVYSWVAALDTKTLFQHPKFAKDSVLHMKLMLVELMKEKQKEYPWK